MSAFAAKAHLARATLTEQLSQKKVHQEAMDGTWKAGYRDTLGRC
jgi:hypothetical protein